MITNMCKTYSKLILCFSKMIPKWPQQDPKMIQTWSNTDSNVFQDESKVKLKSVQHESKLIPKPGPGRSDKKRKRVGLFLTTLPSLIVSCARYLSYAPDTCLMCLILVLCVGYLSYASDTCLICRILVLPWFPSCTKAINDMPSSIPKSFQNTFWSDSICSPNNPKTTWCCRHDNLKMIR